VRVARANMPVERAITDYESARVWLQSVCEYGQSMMTRVQTVRFEPDGTIGRHPTGVGQVFAVVEGAGWVSCADGVRVDVGVGDVVVWDTGEDHDSGTATGMLVCIVQAAPDAAIAQA